MQKYINNNNSNNNNIPMTTSFSSPSSRYSSSSTTDATTASPTAKALTSQQQQQHPIKNTLFLEEDQMQEQETRQEDIGMNMTEMATIEDNNASRSRRGDELGSHFSAQSPNDNNIDGPANSKDGINTSNKSPTPSQRLTPHLQQQTEQKQQQRPDMQQPAMTLTSENFKKRRPSATTASSGSLLQDPHFSKQHQRRRSSATWAHGENGTPWSPWSRWRVVLKLLYAVVVPAVIIYLLKSMDEQIALRKKHQRDLREGGSIWRRKDSTAGQSHVPGVGHSTTKGPSVWWSGGSATGSGGDEQRHSGEVVDEPRKRKSHWYSN